MLVELIFPYYIDNRKKINRHGGLIVRSESNQVTVQTGEPIAEEDWDEEPTLQIPTIGLGDSVIVAKRLIDYFRSIGIATRSAEDQLEDCQTCGCMHIVGFDGDCRDQGNRFN